jgi:hypothetical protein
MMEKHVRKQSPLNKERQWHFLCKCNFKGRLKVQG